MTRPKVQNGRPPRRGTLIIIGGREDQEGERIILKEVARRVKNGRLVLATIASHNRKGYLERYQASFGKLGVDQVTELYICDRKEAQHQDKLDELKGIHAIFFSGGDQLRITSQIGGTPISDRIREIYEGGGVIAGTSAGASAMSETMLVSGESGASFRRENVHMAPGLGLLPDVIIDQHFAERGRMGRLIGAVSQNPRQLGIGIDEDTAIVVCEGRFDVIGSGAVYVVDAGCVSYSEVAQGKAEETPSIYDIKLHVLSAGQTFDLKTRRPSTRSGVLRSAGMR